MRPNESPARKKLCAPPVKQLLSNNRISLLTVICAVAVGLVWVQSASCESSQLIRNLRAGKSQVVLTYGTSLTRPGAWPEQMGAWLAAEFPGQVQLVNRGIPSSASQHNDPFFDALAQLQTRVLANNPDTVFIEFAVNDALDGYNISLQQSRDNLNTMIDRILADRANREIVLMTMNPAWDPPGQFAAGSARPNLAQYYQGYRDVATQRGLLLIDHYANWVNLRNADESLFEQFIPDGVHPTAEALQQVVTPQIIVAITPEPSAAILALVGALLTSAGCHRKRRRTG